MSLGSKAATNLGKQTVKRTFNAFVHDGFSAGFTEMGKAAKWYWKSAKKIILNNSCEQIKGGILGLIDNAIQNRVLNP